MRILARGRQKGKTTDLIKMNADMGGYIVCRSRHHAKMIQTQALTMGLKIPLPMTYGEFFAGNYYGKGVKHVLIDDVDELLRRMFPVTISAITVSVEETWEAND